MRHAGKVLKSHRVRHGLLEHRMRYAWRHCLGDALGRITFAAYQTGGDENAGLAVANPVQHHFSPGTGQGLHPHRTFDDNQIITTCITQTEHVPPGGQAHQLQLRAEMAGQLPVYGKPGIY